MEVCIQFKKRNVLCCFQQKNICNLHVHVTLSPACDPGRFGFMCNDTCGHCLGGELCDVANGSCPSGCEPGYQGNICNEGYYFTNFTHQNHEYTIWT